MDGKENFKKIRMNIPEEMAKLRTALTAMGVHWYDDTETFPIITGIDTDFSIYRTKYKYKGSEYSVICGHGTYGGGEGLLEVWISRKEPTGWHTADDVLAMME